METNTTTSWLAGCSKGELTTTTTKLTTIMESANKNLFKTLPQQKKKRQPHLIFSFKDKYTTEIKFPPRKKQIITNNWKPLPDYFYTSEEKKIKPPNTKVENEKKGSREDDNYLQSWPRQKEIILKEEFNPLMEFSCQCSLVGFENTPNTIIRDQFDIKMGCYNVANLKAEFEMDKEGRSSSSSSSIFIEVAQIYRDEPLWEGPYSHLPGFSFIPVIRACIKRNNWKNIKRVSKPIHGLLRLNEFAGRFSHPAISIDLYEGKLEILNILASEVTRWA